MAMKQSSGTVAHLDALSLLAFSPQKAERAVQHVAALDRPGLDAFFRLADIHHVVIRALQPLAREAASSGLTEMAMLAQAVVDQEQDRINKAITALAEICE
ncbi:MAG: hypothetical protein ACRD4Y_11265, partial [Candidatus Acidiferrales bacterium]